jgi:hypothetical protein
MMRIIPTIIESIAFNRGSPGRLINREKLGLRSVARPIPIIRIPMIGRMIVLIFL